MGPAGQSRSTSNPDYWTFARAPPSPLSRRQLVVLGERVAWRWRSAVDRPGSGVPTYARICGLQRQVAIGRLIGYDFGPVSVQAWFDQTADFWGFDPPAAEPLVAKNDAAVFQDIG
jgi:hypothetical protein